MRLSPEVFDNPSLLLRARLAIFGGGLAIALFSVFVLWGSPGLVAETNDIYMFAEFGRNILEGRGFAPDNGPPTIRRAPLYPAVIALIYWVVGVKPTAIQVVQAFMAAGTTLLGFEIARRLFNFRTGLIAAVMIGFHPMVMRYVPDIQVECILTFLYTLAVHRSVRWLEDDTPLNAFLFGVAVACAAMVKGVALPYAALFFAAYTLHRFRTAETNALRFQGLGRVAVGVGAMALVILPWTARNYNVTGGKFVLISGNASGELLRGYVFAQPHYYLLEKRAYEDGENEANNMQIELFRRQGLVWARDETETELVQNRAAKEKLRNEPGAYVKKCIIGFFMFWYVVTSVRNSLLVGALALAGWILGAIGWWKVRREKRYVFWPLLVPILSLNLIYAAILALGRYSAPVIPTLMVLAAFGVHQLLPKHWLAKLTQAS